MNLNELSKLVRYRIAEGRSRVTAQRADSDSHWRRIVLLWTGEKCNLFSLTVRWCRQNRRMQTYRGALFIYYHGFHSWVKYLGKTQIPFLLFLSETYKTHTCGQFIVSNSHLLIWIVVETGAPSGRRKAMPRQDNMQKSSAFLFHILLHLLFYSHYWHFIGLYSLYVIIFLFFGTIYFCIVL